MIRRIMNFLRGLCHHARNLFASTDRTPSINYNAYYRFVSQLNPDADTFNRTRSEVFATGGITELEYRLTEGVYKILADDSDAVPDLYAPCVSVFGAASISDAYGWSRKAQQRALYALNPALVSSGQLAFLQQVVDQFGGKR